MTDNKYFLGMSFDLSWGLNGYGERHYICNHCELYFGVMTFDELGEIVHDCDESEPRYKNRGVIYTKPEQV
jgi:hypothetical protein